MNSLFCPYGMEENICTSHLLPSWCCFHFHQKALELQALELREPVTPISLEQLNPVNGLMVLHVWSRGSSKSGLMSRVQFLFIVCRVMRQWVWSTLILSQTADISVALLVVRRKLGWCNELVNRFDQVCEVYAIFKRYSEFSQSSKQKIHERIVYSAFFMYFCCFNFWGEWHFYHHVYRHFPLFSLSLMPYSCLSRMVSYYLNNLFVCCHCFQIYSH